MNIQEKSPLLPMNNEEECPRIECYKNKEYKKKYKRQGLLFFLFAVVVFLHNSYQDKVYNNFSSRDSQVDYNDVNINSYLSVESTSDLDDIVLYNKNQMDVFSKPFTTSPSHYTCDSDKPTIPFEGLSKFEFDSNDFSALSIKQNTSSGYRSFAVGSGETKVYQDESISKVTVEFDLKFNKEELQDIFWIEKIEDASKNLYTLVIRADETYVGSDACVIISATVRIPKSDSLDRFTIGLTNNAIEFGENLSFEELSASVANGRIEFSELTTGQTNFALANGHVSGDIKTLNDGLHVSIANGHSEIKIKEITSPPTEDYAIPIEVNLANGHIDLQVPNDFESKFQLNSFVGRRIVDSSKPEYIHRKQSGWGVTSGYFGNNSETRNTIKLSASSGSLHLTYA